MIICVCNGASESRVARAVDEGAATLRDLQRCGIGNGCGMCHEMLREAVSGGDRACASAPACATLSAATS